MNNFRKFKKITIHAVDSAIHLSYNRPQDEVPVIDRADGKTA